MRTLAAPALVALLISLTAAGDQLPRKQPPPVHNWNLNPFIESRGFMLGRVANAIRVRPYSGIAGAIAGVFYSPLLVELRLGTSTVVVDHVDPECVRTAGRVTAACRHRFTPIEIRTETPEVAAKLTSSMHNSVLLSFTERRVVFTTNVRTFATGVYKTNPNHRFRRQYLDRIDNFPISSWFNVQQGTIFGRIVRAEVEGTVRESYLVTVEVGTLGNQFTEMNIASRDLYNYAIECMLSNRPLKMYFLDLSLASQLLPDLVFGYRTSLRLYRIELAKADTLKPTKAN